MPTIAPIGGVGATPFVPPSIDSTTGVARGEKTLFAKSLADVQALEDNANTMAGGVAGGTITDIHQFTAAAAKAQIGIELTAALRNKAVEAYQEIMRMQV